jgi:hypothetical protein
MENAVDLTEPAPEVSEPAASAPAADAPAAEALAAVALASEAAGAPTGAPTANAPTVEAPPAEAALNAPNTDSPHGAAAVSGGDDGETAAVPSSPAADSAKSLGEVSYSSPSMAAARALFSAPKAAAAPVPSPRKGGPSAAALKLGGGGAKAAAAAAAAGEAAAAEVAGPPITVYHKGVYYPLADLVAATRQSPGVFSGIDFNEKELMLNEEGFRAVFGMTHDEFLQMGKWKRDLKKKEKGLF